MASGEIEISQLELADEVLADMVTPVETKNKTMAITLKQLKKWLGSSLPTGFILPAVGKINDERFTLLDGKTLSRTGTYKDFCDKVIEQVQAGNWFSCSEEEYNADVSAYGQCGRFVIANDYVRIPKITRFIGATITLSEIGKTYKESLPNITGEINGIVTYPNAMNIIKGVFSSTEKGVISKGASPNGSYWSEKTTLDFNASNSSSTYQEGAKVQPDHIKYPYYMVISTEGQTASVKIDINKIYEDLNLKANSDLSNVASVASSFKEQSVSWGMPDYSAGVKKANNTQYTAEVDGFLLYNHNGTTKANVLIINDVSINLTTQAQYSHGVALMLPLSKGDNYKLTGEGKILMFFPCKGVN